MNHLDGLNAAINKAEACLKGMGLHADLENNTIRYDRKKGHIMHSGLDRRLSGVAISPRLDGAEEIPGLIERARVEIGKREQMIPLTIIAIDRAIAEVGEETQE